jgi:hypothetical protein
MRAFGTSYTNTSGRPIFVAVTVMFQNPNIAGTSYVQAQVAGATVMYNQTYIPSGSVTVMLPVSFIVPQNATYAVFVGNSVVGGSNASMALNTWMELS